jgi:hypothetical protein
MGATFMEEIEQLVDQILLDWRDGRFRLWLTNLRDRPEEFGRWAGLVRLRAESLANQWSPLPTDLVQRLGENPEIDGCAASARADELLLPMAADALEADLVAMAVPKELARRARDLFTMQPPVAQWKF